MSQPANTDNTENRSVQPQRQQGHTAPPQAREGHRPYDLVLRRPALQTDAAVTGDA